MQAKNWRLRFHRKGLFHNYEEDALTLVLSETQLNWKGSSTSMTAMNLTSDATLTMNWDSSLCRSLKLTVEYESGEGHWIAFGGAG